MIVSYKGSDYAGWQYQPETGKTWTKLQTVQGKLMKAMSKALQTDFKGLRMRAASRTDTGVHSHGQVVEFYSTKRIGTSTNRRGKEEQGASELDSDFISSRKLLFSLNSMLPRSVRCMWVSSVPDSFHVIQDVVMKQYNYYLTIHSVCESPFHTDTRHHISWHKFKSDSYIERLKRAALLMEGTHDFAAFTNKSDDPIPRETVRSVVSCRCLQDDVGVCLQVKGKGFLYKQVRHMVGAMLWVAQGKLELETISEALNEGYAFVQSGKRKWQPAPAAGLHLVWVKYDKLDNGLIIPLAHEITN